MEGVAEAAAEDPMGEGAIVLSVAGGDSKAFPNGPGLVNNQRIH